MTPNSRAIAVLAALTLSGSATASEDKATLLAQLIAGNTLEIKNRYGYAPVYFAPGGEFQQASLKGNVSAGRWRTTEDSVCARVHAEADGKERKEFCLKIADRQLGDAWTNEDPRNGTIYLRLTQGKAF